MLEKEVLVEALSGNLTLLNKSIEKPEASIDC